MNLVFSSNFVLWSINVQGYCCASSWDEKLSRAWEYKRGHGRQEGHFFSHKYSIAVCGKYDYIWLVIVELDISNKLWNFNLKWPFVCRYRICEIRDPFLTYTVNVTVQQLELELRDNSGKEGKREVWKTVGFAEIGPQRFGDNTQRKNPGKTSGPQVNCDTQLLTISGSNIGSSRTHTVWIIFSWGSLALSYVCI